MKLTIRDKYTLKVLSPIDIRAYLVGQGWLEGGRLGNKAAIYTQTDADGREWEILLPIRTDVGDYAERMAEMVNSIAKLEKRSQLEVYYDLTSAGNDVIRLRAPEADESGTIALQDGVALYESTQNLLLSAACAVVKPRPSYHVRKVNEAVEYLDDVRLGQTERGSYVLTVLSPVSPALRRTQQALYPDFDADPFSRLVTRKLADALKAMQAAIAEALASDSFTLFEKSVKQGVSANLCEAIAHLIDHGQGLDLSMTWARVRPAPEHNVRYQFSTQNARILKEAAREFRRNEPRLEETVAGFVIQLDRAAEDFDGNATLQTVFDGRPKRIRVQFAENEYEEAIRAFRDKLPISLDGDMYPVGHRYELRNPRNLLVLTDGDGERG